MAGLRGLHRDLGGFEIADFTDHHHVGVLAKDRAQAAREGHLDLGVHLRLADPFHVVLDGVFHRHDVAALVVEHGECRVERGGLARARRAGDEQDAVRAEDDPLQRLDLHGVEA